MPQSRREHAGTDDALAIGMGSSKTPMLADGHQIPTVIAEAPGDGWTAARAITYAPPQTIPVPAQDLDDPDLPYWLAINRVKGIGPARFKLLLDAFGSAEAAWQGSITEWQAAGLDTRTANSFEQQRKRIVPDAEVERLIKLHVGVLRLTDATYPRLLREITLPPPVLYIRGTLTPEDDWAVAIVGTRRATTYGRQISERLATELTQHGITVVSGLANTVVGAAVGAAGWLTLPLGLVDLFGLLALFLLACCCFWYVGYLLLFFLVRGQRVFLVDTLQRILDAWKPVLWEPIVP